jgi:hypothetical protein
MLFNGPEPRATLLPICHWNFPPPAGINVRRVTGTEVAAPRLEVNCSDSGLSPDWFGRLIVTGIVALECAGIVAGLVARRSLSVCPVKRTDIEPR